MKKLFVILSAAIIIAGFISAWNYHIDHLNDVDQAYVKANKDKPGVVLVDVRPVEVFNGKAPRAGLHGGHIEDSVNFPRSEVIKLINLEDVDKALEILAQAGITRDKELILYCNTGKHASDVASYLVKHFKFKRNKIKNYRGSAVDWLKNPDNKVLSEDHE